MTRRFSWFNLTSLTLGLAFLYLPMMILITYSFNASRLVTVWGGFSTKWYGTLFQNEAFMDAAWITLKVGFWSSTIATVLGTIAANVIVRQTRFQGRTLFSGMIYAPLVMPDVIMGLALLLFFIAIGMDRGVATIVLAHTTLSMCYVTVVVTSRLSTVDKSLEESALDLGCTPLDAFFSVTLPMIAPAVISGWLLAFTLSLDDLVIASFTSGPSSTTLPIKIFSAVRLGVNPEINALSTIMIGIVTVGVISASLLSRRMVAMRIADETTARQR
jgi:putrescine transport system permease protein